MRPIVVTGAAGFIGRSLTALLAARGDLVRATERTRSNRCWPPGVAVHATGDLNETVDWSDVVQGTDCVIHLAGRAHVIRETTSDYVADFRRANIEATSALFRASDRAGVRRFVFVSSIGVLGTASGNKPFDATSEPRPTEPYAVSKWQAERDLAALAGASRTELVIVRPTLVCGAGARGNFERLVKLVARGLPLPLASVRGHRNFVGLTNLCELLALCSKHPAAAGRTYLAADQEIYTTPELIRSIARALSVKAHLLPCPTILLQLAGAALGRRAEIDRLVSSLLVDSSAARAELGWRSTRSMDQEIFAMACAAREKSMARPDSKSG